MMRGVAPPPSGRARSLTVTSRHGIWAGASRLVPTRYLDAGALGTASRLSRVKSAAPCLPARAPTCSDPYVVDVRASSEPRHGAFFRISALQYKLQSVRTCDDGC